MIINAHGHLYHKPKDLDRIVKSGVFEQVWLLDLSPFRCLGEWRATQEEYLEVAQEYKGFFIPFGFLDFRKPPEIVEELHAKGFVGLKAIRPAKPYDDLSYFPYYEKAEKLRMPILFHTGIVNTEPYRKFPEGLGPSSTNMKPMSLFTIAASFPKLTVIGAHLGDPWFEETVRAISKAPNLYFDISGGNMLGKQKWLIDHLHYSAVLQDGTTGGFIGKILMGIDATYGSAESHADIFGAIRDWELFFKSCSDNFIWGRDVEKIMRGNAQKILARLK